MPQAHVLRHSVVTDPAVSITQALLKVNVAAKKMGAIIIRVAVVPNLRVALGQPNRKRQCRFRGTSSFS